MNEYMTKAEKETKRKMSLVSLVEPRRGWQCIGIGASFCLSCCCLCWQGSALFCHNYEILLAQKETNKFEAKHLTWLEHAHDCLSLCATTTTTTTATTTATMTATATLCRLLTVDTNLNENVAAAYQISSERASVRFECGI